MAVFISFVFLVLTPHSINGVCQITTNHCSSLLNNAKFSAAIETARTHERIKQLRINKAVRELEDAEWFRWFAESEREMEVIRSRELLKKANRNPGV